MADEAAEAPPPPPKKSGGGLINALVVFVMALSAVIVGGFINAKLHPLPDLKMNKDGLITAVVPPADAGHAGGEGAVKNSVFLPIDPPLVVNFEDGSVVRFLQVSMEVMAHDQKALDSVQKNLPLIRNNLLLLMSNRNYQALMSREGKDKLREEALAAIRDVQKKQGGEDIDDLLFTSFVVQ
ncbi:MAG TPA: flagellar basal body-associated FliL family protein [Steroidobacteraceae bacterium]|nr:flagellar basal body-associated FliL family protein [Steroidobacteraceae bacterium]